jgi:hypothetical protein
MPKLCMSIQQISIAHVGHVQTPSTLLTATSSVARDIECTACIYDHPSSISTSPNTLYKGTPSIGAYVKVETKTLSRTCHRRCPCQCHIPLKMATPRWLQSLLGATFVNLTGAPILNHRSCDYKACANDTHGTGSVRFTYLFPAWLLRTSVKVNASWGSLSGVTGSWSLRVPRAIYDPYIYNRLQRIVLTASTVGISRGMEESGMRAFDYFALGSEVSYYRTVLEVRIMSNSLFMMAKCAGLLVPEPSLMCDICFSTTVLMRQH